MFPDKQDFVGHLKKEQRVIVGYHGSKTYGVWVGTIKWSIEDDQGQVHDVLIPNSLLVPDGPSSLISPQHWAQNTKIEGEKTVDRDSVQCITLKNRAILKWRTGYVKTIPIYLQNVFTLQLATGKKRFLAYCTEVGYDPYQNDENPDIMVQAQEAPLESNPVTSDYDLINSQSVPQESTPTEGEPALTEGDPINIDGNKPKPNLPATSTKSLEKK